ncbi:cysteine hydrolase family protein [Aurantiacibacter sediminis]|uniref:Cysteine hydrolase n=1 Tax=Aurantiacibacter sediminis TaxID=2793064 RepID=A0ABS0N1Z6_9SPHN|nr:isochorismatase family cysteine hydrolase [Aurantiacibacter sediminis]MBH5321325.1 cysteine hydrolase [Aurantiacibacter sediminis]
MRRVLLVIDMLNDFLDEWPAADRRALIRRINLLIKHFRATGYPVVWVRQEFEPDLSDAFLEMRKKDIRINIKGSEGAKIHSDLDRLDSDEVILKKRYSAFFGTPLDRHLEALAIEEITLCGINTHACIRMAAIDGYQRDLEVVVVTDCVDTGDEEHGRVTLKYLEGKIATLKTTEEVRLSFERN